MQKLNRPIYPSAKAKTAKLHEMVRVNHAGEYGAKRIYQGQLAFTKDLHTRAMIQHMADQEAEHLAYFEDQIRQRGVRPSILQPLWHIGGFALGAATACMGKEAAMACTVAVESVIDEHYSEQEDLLEGDDGEQELKSTISRFRAEEMEHHDTGLAEGAEQAVAYPALSGAIRGLTKLAIEIAKRA